ncbi:MAG: DUF2752 domain-containing protein [Proteocatella sp.]
MYKKYIKNALLTLGGLIITYYVYSSSPSNGPILPCIFYKFTGLYCPGCGMSRALNAFLHGNIYQSFRFNSLPYILSPFCLISYYRYRRKKTYNFIIYTMLVISILYMILRNIPHFKFLAPTYLI